MSVKLSFPRSGGGFSHFQRARRAYEAQLKERPILTKAATSFVGFLLGDGLSQLASDKPYNWGRTAKFALFGAAVHGPGCHAWYTVLEKIVPSTMPKSSAVVAKLVLDQVAWSPFFTCVFYSFMKTLDGATSEIPATLREKVLPTVVAGSVFWVPAHAVNFNFVQPDYRVLYVNVVNVFWTAVLCTIASSSSDELQVTDVVV